MSSDGNPFGGPDSPDDIAQTPAGDLPESGDEFPDGFAESPRKADLDDFAEPFQSILEEKVETYNEEYEDASDRNDEVTDDMVAAVGVRAMGAFTDTHDSGQAELTGTKKSIGNIDLPNRVRPNTRVGAGTTRSDCERS